MKNAENPENTCHVYRFKLVELSARELPNLPRLF
jgi:hypothetical protein